MFTRLEASVSEEELRAEAENLLRRARDLRATLPMEEVLNRKEESSSGSSPRSDSKWRVKDNDGVTGIGYRLAMDIGREEGTWMDPRWGASGRRISLSLDVLFSDVVADTDLQRKMINDNLGGQRSSVYRLETATAARLRNGFDEMKCSPGAYRIDSGGNGKQTARFVIPVSGTPERGSPYGDVSIPEGCLYFSVPCFGGVSNLSTKEGIITVRQMGWHTGWRREESRIIGTVYASPIEMAMKRDRF